MKEKIRNLFDEMKVRSRYKSMGDIINMIDLLSIRRSRSGLPRGCRARKILNFMQVYYFRLSSLKAQTHTGTSLIDPKGLGLKMGLFGFAPA